MDRLTGTDAFGLMEAYSNVYAQQELTEEQVWEEVENWVNGLVEEGYDLSDYTWEDMYEEYLNEYAAGGVPGSGGGVTLYSRPIANTGQPYQSRFARPRQDRLRSLNTPSNSTRRPGTVSNIPPSEGTGRGAPGSRIQLDPGRFERERQRLRGVGNPPVAPRPGATTPAPTRPAPAPSAPRPGATSPAPARPTPTRPATPSYAGATGVRPVGTTPLPTNAVQPVAGAPAQNAPVSVAAPRPSLAQQAAELRKMRLASQMRQAGQNVVSTQLASFDPFDVVMGHLIDEGYADTEESAMVIMANMSEEWKQSILETEDPATKKRLDTKSRQVQDSEMRAHMAARSGTYTIPVKSGGYVTMPQYKVK